MPESDCDWVNKASVRSCVCASCTSTRALKTTVVDQVSASERKASGCARPCCQEAKQSGRQATMVDGGLGKRCERCPEGNRRCCCVWLLMEPKKGVQRPILETQTTRPAFKNRGGGGKARGEEEGGLAQRPGEVRTSKVGVVASVLCKRQPNPAQDKSRKAARRQATAAFSKKKKGASF